MNIKELFLSISLLFVFVGCAETIGGYSGVLNQYDAIYDNQICDDKFVEEKIKSKSDLIMWYELGASHMRNCFDYNKSNYYLDQAENLYQSDVDLENQAFKATKAVTSVILNDNIDSYRGNVYETIMLNVYKGLNFMSIGDFKNARVEFNRALDRQRRAKDSFRKEIDRRVSELKNKDQDITKIALNPTSVKTVTNLYDSGIFANFKAYPDFVNPFATYISALFFMADKDYKKARYLLKENIAMEPNNQVFKDDFALVNALLKNPNLKKKYIWLIYENGKSARKNEMRVDVPLFVVSENVPYIGMVFPNLQEQSSSYPFLKIQNQKTNYVADMDRVIKTEFKTKLPFIITRSLIRTTIKTVATYSATKEDELLGFGLTLFSAFTNRADIRGWVSLPKNFQVLRVENDGSTLTITSPDDKVITSISTPKDKNMIVYINSPVMGVDSVHKILF
ncbi:hypothetical protein [uncultured Campylobacter sp.]|uniref:COG3014 family protein n=1 Tax=uncultured Campylobacter sp. TaxID=218934 RepID=UPI0026102883|nr:hypothetical protein [uncultured Campylobacter sp.]